MLMHKSSQLNNSIKSIFYQAVAFAFSLSIILLAVPSSASAAAITSRKLTLGSSVASGVTSYSFSFVLPSATTILSAEASICDAPSGTCNIPAGFSVSVPGSAVVAPTNFGSGGTWVVSNATAGKLRMSNATNSGSPTGTSTMGWTGVTNQSAANSTFYARITTYSTSTWTGAIDTGTVAAATAGQITVTANVDEALTFTLASSTVALGTITTGTTGSGTSTMVASTNGATGYAISVNGSTLTAPGGTIPAYVNAGSAAGTAGFGINLVSNTTPTIGTNISGAGSGAASTSPQYNAANSYRFVSGDTVAAAGIATNSNTVSYVANINGATPAGAYTTALTYIATATF
jgi:hypothetical protein